MAAGCARCARAVVGGLIEVIDDVLVRWPVVSGRIEIIVAVLMRWPIICGRVEVLQWWCVDTV